MSADPSPAVRSRQVPWRLVLTVATAYTAGALFAFGVLNGLERLVTATRAQPRGRQPDQWCEAILHAMTNHSHVEDDIVLICVRLLGVPAGAPARPQDWDQRR